MFKKSKLQIGP